MPGDIGDVKKEYYSLARSKTVRNATSTERSPLTDSGCLSLAVASRFAVGQLVRHRLSDFRGVVVDVDFSCQRVIHHPFSEANVPPPLDRPWYHVLIHDSDQRTYVAEDHLVPDPSGEPVEHPHLPGFFCAFANGGYLPRNPRH